jgi:hypothetical protein
VPIVEILLHELENKFREPLRNLLHVFLYIYIYIYIRFSLYLGKGNHIQSICY